VTGYKIAEYTYAVLKDRPHFHINIVSDVSPFCDCYARNDIGIVPDIGMFASFDPVAVDKACADAVNSSPANANSMLEQHIHKHEDHFKSVHPASDWKACLAHCEKLGVGTQDYELINL